MKKVITIVQAWCDYPGCAEKSEAVGEESQDTATVEFCFYVKGRGRKTQPITVELCEEHREEMRALYTAMQKFDQKDE